MMQAFFCRYGSCGLLTPTEESLLSWLGPWPVIFNLQLMGWEGRCNGGAIVVARSPCDGLLVKHYSILLVDPSWPSALGNTACRRSSSSSLLTHLVLIHARDYETNNTNGRMIMDIVPASSSLHTNTALHLPIECLYLALCPLSRLFYVALLTSRQKEINQECVAPACVSPQCWGGERRSRGDNPQIR